MYVCICEYIYNIVCIDTYVNSTTKLADIILVNKIN